VAYLADRFQETVRTPALLPGCFDLTRKDELLKRATKRALRDLWSYATMDVALRRARIPLEIFDDERAQAVGLDARERRQSIETGFTQQRGLYEVPRGLRAPSLIDESLFDEPAKPWPEIAGFG